VKDRKLYSKQMETETKQGVAILTVDKANFKSKGIKKLKLVRKDIFLHIDKENHPSEDIIVLNTRALNSGVPDFILKMTGNKETDGSRYNNSV
jgi:hypothetical protein